jgi:hypothetical protein
VPAELHPQIPGEVLYGRDVLKGLVEPFLEEPLETVALQSDKIRYVEDLRDLGERATLAQASLDKTGSGSTGHQAFPPPDVGLNCIARQTYSLRKRRDRVKGSGERRLLFSHPGLSRVAVPIEDDRGREREAPGPGRVFGSARAT